MSQSHAAAMAKQFNVPPSRETVALYHQVRGDKLGTAPGLAGEGSELLLGLQASLDHIQASITALQSQVQQHVTPVSRMQRSG